MKGLARSAAASVFAVGLCVRTPVAHADEPAPSKPPAIASADGVPVNFLSPSASTIIYLAHGDVAENTEPDPFEKIGVAPVSVKLSPGTYTVETEGPTQSNGHQRFVVEHDSPLTVRIHPGDPTLKTVGAVLIALGIVSAVLGVVAIVSITKDDAGYDRWGIGLPLTIGGSVGAGLGFAMTAMGSTNVDAPHLPPNTLHSTDRVSWQGPSPVGLAPTLVFRF